MGKTSGQTYFANKINKELIKQLPAESVPILSRTDLNKRKEKTLFNYNKSLEVIIENSSIAKVLTKEDEYYFTVMAKADFTGDGIEDLLIRTEWYARKAFGKHVDLIVLSKISKDTSVKISWRLSKIN